MDSKVVENIREMQKSLRVLVKIPHDEADRITVSRLIGIRNAEVNKNENMSFIDKTITWFLTEEEFQKYVIEQQEIEY